MHDPIACNHWKSTQCQKIKWVKWGIPRRVDMFCLIHSLFRFASFFFFLFIRDNTFVRFLCSLFLSSSLVNLMVLLYMSVRLIKKNIYVSYAEYNWNDKYIVFCELIGRKLKIAARHLCLNIILNRIDLVVDTYLANIMFDVIHILSGLTSHIFSHDDWLSS